MLFFTAPFIYLAGAPDHFIYSFFTGLNQPIGALPYGQSVCVTWTIAYGQIGLGAWLICPLGGIQTLLTAQPAASYILPTLLALLLFLLPILILGNFFCGWICPIGTLIDSFDRAISKWLPKIDAKRQQRFLHNKEKEKLNRIAQVTSRKNIASIHLPLICPSCIIGKAFGTRHSAIANCIIITSLVGSALLRFPVFCMLCPIGAVTRGMFHLKAWTYLTNTMMPIILELTIIPLIAVLISLREKRFWCRKICPVGATLNLAGSISPFIKPDVKTEKCLAKGCQTTSDYQYQVSCNRCERACPQGISLGKDESLIRCTKCLECYIVCERKAVTIKPVSTPQAVSWFKQTFRRKPKIHKTNEYE